MRCSLLWLGKQDYIAYSSTRITRNPHKFKEIPLGISTCTTLKSIHLTTGLLLSVNRLITVVFVWLGCNECYEKFKGLISTRSNNTPLFNIKVLIEPRYVKLQSWCTLHMYFVFIFGSQDSDGLPIGGASG